jgi:lipoyl(octanoyl) transferase
MLTTGNCQPTTTLISILQLGRIDYATGLRLQKTLIELRHDKKIDNVLLLLEHTPVITLGRNAKKENILASPERLKQEEVEVHECDRGGDVTYHGPGQLVGYPIFDLRSFPGPDGQIKTVGAVEYVRRIEEVLIRTCADFGVAAGRIPKLTGVWTEPAAAPAGAPLLPDFGRSGSVQAKVAAGALLLPGFGRSGSAQAKVAAIGVHISRGITSHGFALNVNTNLDHFKLIVPCGISTKPVTSLKKERGRELSLSDVSESAARNFGRVFSSQILWVESLDALLGRTVGVPLKMPPEPRLLHADDTHWA